MRQQHTQHNGNQQATSMRKPSSSQRAETQAYMTTEYQERFLPPHCHKTVVTSATRKDPYHPLKGTSADTTTYRAFYVTRKWIKHPPKDPQPSLPPKDHRRCSSDPHNPVCFAVNQTASNAEDYTSVYRNDFQAWNINKLQPYKLCDSLKVNQGLVVTNNVSKEGRPQKKSVQVAANSKPVPQVQEPQPFDSVTSYRLDYVTHPLQPRRRTEKPVYHTKGLLSAPAMSLKPKVALDINQELFDQTSEIFQKFKTWSLETKFHGQGKTKEFSPPADDFLSTTHADYTAHKCERTKPFLPSMQPTEKSNEPFEATTTMKEDYKAWNVAQCLPIVGKKQSDWARKITFPVGTPKPTESCTTNPKPFSHPTLNQTAACNCCCNATQTPQRLVEHGMFCSLECISTGTRESRTHWTTSLDRGVTWADGGICEEPSQDHQIISCLVSSTS
ncbi:stabilizer of axonemal microtubules 2 [Epinephelus lanceolatus]|uniref:stabilizer of axonemal microtubules 2 n=1 Tax=Epinephelus lanceolatus TaxID=310571 RepID=UPI001448973B|nr:stabilizer of axonemal microtubules 2 [Epinephelus lanceolatus]